MLFKNLLHSLYNFDSRRHLIVETFSKQHFKTKCIVALITNFVIYSFCSNNFTQKITKSIFTFSTRNNILKCFNVKTKLKLLSMRLVSQRKKIIEIVTFAKITSFSNFVSSLRSTRSISKIMSFLI